MVIPKALPYTHGGTLIIGWGFALLVIATISVALRFWSRLLTKIRFGLDDWLVLASLITYYSIAIIAILAVKYGGLGYEEVVVLATAPEDLNYLLIMLFAYTWAYAISSQLIKLTVLAFYWRIFPTKFIRTSCIIISSISISFMISMMFVNGLQCRPITYYWTQVGDATCIDLTAYYFAVSVINFIIDLCTLVLPLREVWRLHAPFWRRVGICGVFFLGSIVVVASLVRMVLMRQFEISGLGNMTWDLVPGWVMTVIEVAVGIIGACLPTLVPVYRKLRYGSIEPRDSSSNDKHTSYQLRHNSRTTLGKLSLGSRIPARGETKPSRGRHLPTLNGAVGSFDSFEMLSDPPGYSDIEQQADIMRGSGCHGAEQQVRIHADSVSSHDDGQPAMDTARGIRVRHDVVWTESRQPKGTNDWR